MIPHLFDQKLLKYLYQPILLSHVLQLFENNHLFHDTALVLKPFTSTNIVAFIYVELSLFFLNHYIYRQTKKATSKNYVDMKCRIISILRIVCRNEIATLFCSRFHSLFTRKKNELEWGCWINNGLYKLHDYLSEYTALTFK